MFTSLFGELENSKPHGGGNATKVRNTDVGALAFAATAILETVSSDTVDSAHLIDRHQHDLVFSGSPARAIREHFAATRPHLETASRLITLIDPTGLWAADVLRALSDAGGRPLDRLHLREQGTLRTLATIERSTLVRRHEETLKIYRVDVRAQCRENAEIPVALMERSHMTVVMVGAMQPHALDALLDSLRDACRLPTWRCPNLLFLVPPSESQMSHRITAMVWPVSVSLHVISEPMASASSAWNAMLRMWNQVKKTSTVVDAGLGMPTPISFSRAAETARLATTPVEPTRAQWALTHMLHLEGLLGCAVIDSHTSLVLARETREDHPVDMSLAASTGAALLQTHRLAALNMGLTDAIDEILTSSPTRHCLLRTLPDHTDVFLLVVLERHRADLAAVRLQLQALGRNLN